MSVAFPIGGAQEGLPLGSTTMIDNTFNRGTSGFNDVSPMSVEEAAFHRANFLRVTEATVPAEVSFLGRLGAALRGLFGLGTALGTTMAYMQSSNQRMYANALADSGMNPFRSPERSSYVQTVPSAPAPRPTVPNTPSIPPVSLPKPVTPVGGTGNYPFFLRKKRHPR